jgi:hypothetical protein
MSFLSLLFKRWPLFIFFHSPPLKRLSADTLTEPHADIPAWPFSNAYNVALLSSSRNACRFSLAVRGGDVLVYSM